MGAPRYRINLTEQEREALDQLTRQHTAKQSMVRRAKIILMAGEGERRQDIAAKLGVRSHVVTTWTKRWLEKLAEPVAQRLEDLPRPGAPDTFTPEQLCQLMALACESPQDHGRPMTHWTHRELAAEAIKQGIVESISPHHLGRLLKKRLATPSHPVLAKCQS
jgi:putative transposase